MLAVSQPNLLFRRDDKAACQSMIIKGRTSWDELLDGDFACSPRHVIMFQVLHTQSPFFFGVNPSIYLIAMGHLASGK
jgi:hypothetical protein